MEDRTVIPGHLKLVNDLIAVKQTCKQDKTVLPKNLYKNGKCYYTHSKTNIFNIAKTFLESAKSCRVSEHSSEIRVPSVKVEKTQKCLDDDEKLLAEICQTEAKTTELFQAMGYAGNKLHKATNIFNRFQLMALEKRSEVVIKAAKNLYSKSTRTLLKWTDPNISKLELIRKVNAGWESLPDCEKQIYVSQVLSDLGLETIKPMLNPQLSPNSAHMAPNNTLQKEPLYLTTQGKKPGTAKRTMVNPQQVSAHPPKRSKTLLDENRTKKSIRVPFNDDDDLGIKGAIEQCPRFSKDNILDPSADQNLDIEGAVGESLSFPVKKEFTDDDPFPIDELEPSKTTWLIPDDSCYNYLGFNDEMLFADALV